MDVPPPMSTVAFVATIFAPSILFMIFSIPVKRRNIIQEAVLALLWFTELTIPLYYAGQFSYACLISTSVWAWASSMKMGVWVFSMTMDERRQRAFIFTMANWRSPSSKKTQIRPDQYIDTHLAQLVWTTVKRQVAFDTVDFIFNYCDSQRPVRVFSALMGKSTEPLSWSSVGISLLMCMLFCVYLQLQLQVTWDAFMVMYACIYKCLPTLERWQLGQDSQKLDTKNIAKTKAILRRVRGIRSLKGYLEETLEMPPLFDSPWSADSLRNFWGKRWHTIYNECFYRLGYRPIRWTSQMVYGKKPARWVLPLSVFVMSGLMHEYFLYAATGPTVYFGKPLPACGLQFAFFFIQVACISVGDILFNKGGFAGQAYAIFAMSMTSHLFVVPYILTGYMTMERFSFFRLAANLYQANPRLYASIF
ncbi:hypothetical protein INT47_012329 [Mucor saturninus]|uniref:Wax synthase domain-containing protein n=1 Tax=Mucor saturninus TaxID=64648 RepID=A0A8H7V252_9FUNG|nr:hypothetical protein INT47_012329 [Mucor saturninus]